MAQTRGSYSRSRLLRRVGIGLAAVLVATSCSGSSSSDNAGADEPGQPDAPVEWPHLGLDLANTRAQVDETAIGPGNVESLRPEWELAGVNGVTGTPIVDDGVLYVGSWDGRLHALDAATGDEVWSEDLGSQIPGAIAIDGSRVFAGTWGGQLVALDRETGNEAWSESVGDHDLTMIYGSPVHMDGLVIVGVGSAENMVRDEAFTFRGNVVAFDAETGNEKWRYWTTCGPENAGQDNCPEGAEEGPGVSVWASPAVDTKRGLVYIGTGQHYEPPTTGRSDALIALDLATGEEEWVYQFTEDDFWTLPGLQDPDTQVGPDADIGTPPSLFQVDGVDAVGGGDKAGTYKALDRETGEELWSQDLTDGGTQGGVMASPAVVDDTIFLTSNRGGQDADLIALDTADGAVLWRTDVEGSVVGPVTWANGVVYVADNKARFSAFDAEKEGERLWSHEVGVQAAGGISVVDGMVYAGWGWSMGGVPEDGGMIAFSLDGTNDPDDESEDGGDGEVDGATVFQQSCALCHGDDGSGGSGPELTDVGDRLSVEEQLDVVRNGRGDQMPAWEGSLSPEAIEAVVDYVNSNLSSDP